MNERIRQLVKQSGGEFWQRLENDFPVENDAVNPEAYITFDPPENLEKFVELIVEDMRRKVIASILITDVLMEEKGQVPTSEDYILAINKDFGVEE